MTSIKTKGEKLTLAAVLMFVLLMLMALGFIMGRFSGNSK